MNALNHLNSRRIEAMRASNRRGIPVRVCLVFVVLLILLMAFANSLWSSTLWVGNTQSLRVMAQIHPFRHVAQVSTDGIYVYDASPILDYNCERWTANDLKDITSPNEEGRLWKSNTLIVPMMCSHNVDVHIGEVLHEMDQDPSTAGQTIVWILPDAALGQGNGMELLNRRTSHQHLIHPLDFVPIDSIVSDSKKEHILWTSGMPMEQIGSSQFCRYDKGSFQREFFLFVLGACIPVVNTNAILPLSSFIIWEEAVLRIDPDVNLDEYILAVAEHAVKFKLRVGKAIRNHLVSLSRKDAFLYIIVYR